MFARVLIFLFLSSAQAQPTLSESALPSSSNSISPSSSPNESTSLSPSTSETISSSPYPSIDLIVPTSTISPSSDPTSAPSSSSLPVILFTVSSSASSSATYSAIIPAPASVSAQPVVGPSNELSPAAKAGIAIGSAIGGFFLLIGIAVSIKTLKDSSSSSSSVVKFGGFSATVRSKNNSGSGSSSATNSWFSSKKKTPATIVRMNPTEIAAHLAKAASGTIQAQPPPLPPRRASVATMAESGLNGGGNSLQSNNNDGLPISGSTPQSPPPTIRNVLAAEIEVEIEGNEHVPGTVNEW